MTKVYTVQLHQLGKEYRDMSDVIVACYLTREKAEEDVKDFLQEYLNDDSEEKVEITDLKEYSKDCRDNADNDVVGYSCDFDPDGYFYVIEEIDLKQENDNG